MNVHLSKWNVIPKFAKQEQLIIENMSNNLLNLFPTVKLSELSHKSSAGQ
jgi:hypothetical protein